MKATLTLLIFLTVFPLNIFAQDIAHTVLERYRGSNTYSVAFSPDGSILAAVSGNGNFWDRKENTIRLWDVETGNYLRTLEEHTGNVYSVAFSPNGRTLFSRSRNLSTYYLYLWDVATGEKKLSFTYSRAAFSTDMQTIASTGDHNTIRLWDVETGTLKHTLTVDNSRNIVFSPDGQTLTSWSSDSNTIHLWDVETGTLKHTLNKHTDRVWRAVFSPDGQTLASSSHDKTICLWNVDTGTIKHTLPTHGGWTIEFSPDGQTLVSAGDRENTIRLSDVETGTHKFSITTGLRVFSPDGQTLVSVGGGENTVRLWDVKTGTLNATLVGHTERINSIVFSPDGQTLASGSNDNTVRLWKLIDTRIGITVLSVDSPAIGDQLTLKVDITSGENVTGFQAKVIFDATALRYVNSYNGDYLPNNSFFVDPVIEGNVVTLGATSLADSSSGDGTLATLTFEFIAIKESTLSLPEAAIVDSEGKRLPFFFKDISVIVGVPRLREDVNLDGVVDILDLTLVAASFGKTTDKQQQVENTSGDVNEDGVIDIVDLVLVAGALGDKAAAPTAYPQASAMFTAADVQQWLSQAQQRNLTNPTSQRGILFLEQLLAALTPKKTSLLPNYPNPFNPETWIPYQLAEPEDVTVTIYAIDGTVVRTLSLGHQPVGIYQDKSRAAHWDGKNALGESVASGVYFYKLEAGDFTATRKMLIRK